jgi:hypothetical protein
MPPIANIGYAHIYARNVNPATDLLTLVIDSTDSFQRLHPGQHLRPAQGRA